MYSLFKLKLLVTIILLGIFGLIHVLYNVVLPSFLESSCCCRLISDIFNILLENVLWVCYFLIVWVLDLQFIRLISCSSMCQSPNRCKMLNIFFEPLFLKDFGAKSTQSALSWTTMQKWGLRISWRVMRGKKMNQATKLQTLEWMKSWMNYQIIHLHSIPNLRLVSCIIWWLLQ